MWAPKVDRGKRLLTPHPRHSRRDFAPASRERARARSAAQAATCSSGWLGALSLSPGFPEESLTAVSPSLQATLGQWRCPRNSLVLRLGGWFFLGARLGRCSVSGAGGVRLAAGAAPFSPAVNVARRHLRRRRRAARDVTRDVMREAVSEGEGQRLKRERVEETGF